MDEFDGTDERIERRLRTERPELSAIELDQVKQGVVARVMRQGGRGMRMKSRLATMLLIVGLVATGGGAVLAASGGSSSNGSSANSQYCPPSSPGGGKPKDHGKGGNKCGQCPEAGSSDKKKCQCDDSSQADDKDKCKKGGNGS